MNIADILAPLTLSEFKTKFFGKRSVAITRVSNPFPAILTLDEIEQKLNDGCATVTSLGIIGEDGIKMPLDAVYNNAAQIRWSPFAMKKRFVLDKLQNRHSFVMHNMTQINRHIADIADSIEAEFPDFHADLHIYVSPRPSATGYNVHRDSPQHKIYLQLIGTTYWTVYRGIAESNAMSLAEADKHLEVDFRSELTPGSVLYMPPDTYHHVTNGNDPRVSLSFPFIHDPSRVRMDRTHIPFKSIFEMPDRSAAHNHNTQRARRGIPVC